MKVQSSFSLKAVIAILGFSFICFAQQSDIKLPAPQLNIGKPLMEVLKLRKTSREFSSQKLSLQELSNLLWAAYGINRPETGGRTAPSAMNKQEIDVYLAMQEGLFLYDAKGNTLKALINKDLRALTGTQAFVKDAPLNIVFVADQKRSGSQEWSYGLADASFISENIYLYCASEGLATVVRASVDKKALGEAMGLDKTKMIVMAQTVGYPKTK
jgi:SagB-type dehydrogenase family enzyme